jgi:uroporphyrinogen-III decarboxylase
MRHLIDTVGKNGGFMLDAGGGIDGRGKVENVRAMIRTAKEYGVY